uniref:BEN domain-containing protein n=1 Tax=Strongyloides venezuelensis TaxID=75913 RepID=A0A0K0FY86_STRVS
MDRKICNQFPSNKLKIYSLLDDVLLINDWKYIVYNFHDTSKIKLFNQNCLVKNKKENKTLAEIEEDFVKKVSDNDGLRILKKMFNRAKCTINTIDTSANGLKKQIERKREKETRKRKLEAALERQRKRKAEYEKLMGNQSKVLVLDNKENNLKLYKIVR